MNPNRNHYDTMTLWQLIVIVTLCTAFILISLIVGISQAIVYVETCKSELRAAEDVNLRQKVIYNSQANIDYVLMTQREYEERKKIYDAEELDFQKKKTLELETRIAKEMCPIGSYVRIFDINETVRISGFIGYEAQTYEGINFQVVDIDNWEFTSRDWYVARCQVKGRIPR